MPSLTPEIPQLPTTRYACRHIHASGRRCGSPALRGEHFCYHHHHTRPQPIEPTGPYDRFDLPAFALEDRPAIQHTLTLLATRIAQNRIDPARARLLLYLAQLASNNLPAEPRRTAKPPETKPSAPEAAPIETLTHDPDLGPLAPELELPTPTQPSPSDTIETLENTVEDLRTQLRAARKEFEDRPCPHCNLLPPLPHRWDSEDFMKLNPHIPHRPKHPTPPKPKPEPEVVPTLQACTEPLQPTTYHLKPHRKTRRSLHRLQTCSQPADSAREPLSVESRPRQTLSCLSFRSVAEESAFRVPIDLRNR